jgi:hypothetical protein
VVDEIIRSPLLWEWKACCTFDRWKPRTYFDCVALRSVTVCHFGPGIAVYLSLAYTIDGNFAGALTETDRGLKLQTPDFNFLRTGVLIALNKGDWTEIDKRVRALPDSEPRSQLHHQLARFKNQPAGAAIEIQKLAATVSLMEKRDLAYWAAYYQEPELSLELWTSGSRSPRWPVATHDAKRAQAAGLQRSGAGDGAGGVLACFWLGGLLPPDRRQGFRL